jgi:hypothetical protein
MESQVREPAHVEHAEIGLAPVDVRQVVEVIALAPERPNTCRIQRALGEEHRLLHQIGRVGDRAHGRRWI